MGDIDRLIAAIDALAERVGDVCAIAVENQQQLTELIESMVPDDVDDVDPAQSLED